MGEVERMLEFMLLRHDPREDLFEILEYGQEDEVEDSLSNLIDFFRDGRGETILHRAMMMEDVRPSVIQLIIDKMEDVDLPNRQHQTPLILAAFLGKQEIVETLLDAGADPDARDLQDRTALMEAAKNNHPGVVEALVRAGADCELTDRDGKTALMMAKDRGYSKIVDILEPHPNGSNHSVA